MTVRSMSMVLLLLSCQTLCAEEPVVPPALPKMAMLASVCVGQKNKNSAMLRINDKTEMVYIGDKMSTLQNNALVEIQILDIHKHYVKVRVLPANETIILR